MPPVSRRENAGGRAGGHAVVGHVSRRGHGDNRRKRHRPASRPTPARNRTRWVRGSIVPWSACLTWKAGPAWISRQPIRTAWSTLAVAAKLKSGRNCALAATEFDRLSRYSGGRESRGGLHPSELGQLLARA